MKRLPETYGPAYDAADVSAVLLVSCSALLILALLYAVGRYVMTGGTILDELLEGDDICEDCSRTLTERNRAVTCASHLLCDDCDRDHNPCRECRFAMAELEVSW